MFTTQGAFSGFAVRDIEEARTFYGEVLGMQVQPGEMGLLQLTLDSGAVILIYPREGHEPATFTILNFPVADVEAAVDDLVARGVQIARYEGYHHDDRGIVRGAGPDIAWFTDPSGNILSVYQD